MCYIVYISAFCFDPEFLRYFDALLLVLDLIASISGRLVKNVCNLSSMIGMGGCTADNCTQIISACYSMSVGSANTLWRLGRNSAGAHRADSAADTVFTKLTVILLILSSCLPCIYAHIASSIKQNLRIAFHLFHCGKFLFGHIFSP